MKFNLIFFLFARKQAHEFKEMRVSYLFAKTILFLSNTQKRNEKIFFKLNKEIKLNYLGSRSLTICFNIFFFFLLLNINCNFQIQSSSHNKIIFNDRENKKTLLFTKILIKSSSKKLIFY